MKKHLLWAVAWLLLLSWQHPSFALDIYNENKVSTVAGDYEISLRQIKIERSTDPMSDENKKNIFYGIKAPLVSSVAVSLDTSMAMDFSIVTENADAWAKFCGISDLQFTDSDGNNYTLKDAFAADQMTVGELEGRELLTQDGKKRYGVSFRPTVNLNNYYYKAASIKSLKGNLVLYEHAQKEEVKLPQVNRGEARTISTKYGSLKISSREKKNNEEKQLVIYAEPENRMQKGVSHNMFLLDKDGKVIKYKSFYPDPAKEEYVFSIPSFTQDYTMVYTMEVRTDPNIKIPFEIKDIPIMPKPAPVIPEPAPSASKQ